jgi:hypothetical protein
VNPGSQRKSSVPPGKGRPPWAGMEPVKKGAINLQRTRRTGLLVKCALKRKIELEFGDRHVECKGQVPSDEK